MRPLLVSLLLICGCTHGPDYNLILRGGTIYDGSGTAPYIADIAVDGDSIAAIGDLADVRGILEINVEGFAVSPGFINMLSWATESLIVDGRSLSDISQGVTLEVFGEGVSNGPLNEVMKEELWGWVVQQAGSEEAAEDLLGGTDVPWTTLDEYLSFLESKGVSPNVASLIGAATVRQYVLGENDRVPTPEELERMQNLVREAMADGALGVGSSLIYVPGTFASTQELIALASVAGEFGGVYTSHIRSEGGRLLESVEELIQIAQDADVRGHIYHLKAAGKNNWHKMEAVIDRIEEVRAEGLEITADIYTYVAGATGLDAAMPPDVREGGMMAWHARLQDPAIRARMETELMTPSENWENLMLEAGPENVMLVGFRTAPLRQYMGLRLTEVAELRGTSIPAAVMDLILEDTSRVGAIYFLMDEANVRQKLRQPWVAIDSDATSIAPEGHALNSMVHPRTYGSFARLLAKYVRQEQVLLLEEAVRRMTSLPASILAINRRGMLKQGYFADIAIFDPQRIQDHATFEDPHQLATGMHYVFVNGTMVLDQGEHTGVMPGRVVRRSTQANQ
ncbi:MAG: D-aminoacylase [Rhodothermaceae bacterium]|nr:D-aminoacylase [Rhodothermaceae bacterium]MXZ59089.1 D-aminoacylase [Rhodothermaceae bacterium]MYB90332.1 D-aminoacylase [Rhodothermaceae bacterium]MYD68492.1 D-aminoacylase [Rhodothermaceae bacterium]MYG45623.1 D-aminoacylase [Rhodothermaceae bacterium]